MDKEENDKKIAELESQLALLSPQMVNGQMRPVEGDPQEIHRQYDKLWAEKRALEMEGSRPGRRMMRAREEGRDARGPRRPRRDA